MSNMLNIEQVKERADNLFRRIEIDLVRDGLTLYETGGKEIIDFIINEVTQAYIRGRVERDEELKEFITKNHE